MWVKRRHGWKHCDDGWEGGLRSDGWGGGEGVVCVGVGWGGGGGVGGCSNRSKGGGFHKRLAPKAGASTGQVRMR